MALIQTGKVGGRNYKFGGGVEILEPCALLNEDGVGTVESGLAVSQKVRELPSYDPAVPVLGLYIFERIIGRDLNR